MLNTPRSDQITWFPTQKFQTQTKNELYQLSSRSNDETTVDSLYNSESFNHSRTTAAHLEESEQNFLQNNKKGSSHDIYKNDSQDSIIKLLQKLFNTESGRLPRPEIFELILERSKLDRVEAS